MAKYDEISSTEKLLDMIRSHDKARDEFPNGFSQPQFSKKRKPLLTGRWPFKRTVLVGVDFGRKDLKLVKARQSSDQQWNLLGYRSVPFDPQITQESPQFPHLLKATLADFCGSSGTFELWVLMSSAVVEVRQIRIPKVPKKQIANAVYWTLKKEVPFDEEDSIFDFDVLGDVVEQGVQKKAIMVYIAPKHEIKRLKNLFSKTGFPLGGISIAPFAIQNLLRTRWVQTGEKTVGSLSVGEDWSRIDIFSSGNLVLTRGIKSGMNSLIEGIIEGVNERENRPYFESGSGKDVPLPLSFEGEKSIDTEQARKILLTLRPDSLPYTKTDPGLYFKEEEVFRMILSALDRLVRQIERSFEHYGLNLGNDKVSKIYMAGEISSFTRLVDYISNQVGLPTDILDPFSSGTPFSEALSAPDSSYERTSFVPAVGMSLSDNSYTPNFIFTHQDKQKLASVPRINRAIFVVFMFIIAICTGVFLWQTRLAREKQSKIIDLQQRLEQYSPRLNQNFILQLAAKGKQKSRILKEYSRKYFGMAVIGEVCRTIPSNIRLLSVTANLGRVSGGKEGGGGETKALILEGMVFGDQQRLEASLAAYLVSLEACPLFRQPKIRKSSFETEGGQEVLHFTAQIGLV